MTYGLCIGQTQLIVVYDEKNRIMELEQNNEDQFPTQAEIQINASWTDGCLVFMDTLKENLIIS